MLEEDSIFLRKLMMMKFCFDMILVGIFLQTSWWLNLNDSSWQDKLVCIPHVMATLDHIISTNNVYSSVNKMLRKDEKEQTQQAAKAIFLLLC